MLNIYLLVKLKEQRRFFVHFQHKKRNVKKTQFFYGFTLLNYHFLFIFQANLHKTFDHISPLDGGEL
jgi:hypothetical protein